METIQRTDEWLNSAPDEEINRILLSSCVGSDDHISTPLSEILAEHPTMRPSDALEQHCEDNEIHGNNSDFVYFCQDGRYYRLVWA